MRWGDELALSEVERNPGGKVLKIKTSVFTIPEKLLGAF